MRIQWPVQADPKEAVYHKTGLKRQLRLEFLEPRLRIDDIDQVNLAVIEILAGVAGVIAVVALARENYDQITLAGQLPRARCHEVTDAADDLGLVASRRPRGPFPFTHL